MIHAPFILAEGIPAPLIFFGFVALIMVLSGVFGKAKPTPPVSLGGTKAEAARQRAEAQRRVLERRGIAAPPPMPQKASKRQAASARKAAAAPVAPMPARPVATPRPVVAAAPLAPVASRQSHSEVARNLKLMLQRGGVREAILLGEVLGKPKSLRDDA